MEDYKLINVRVFEPAFKNIKARCEYTYCKNSENCNLYKQGKCVHDYTFIIGCIKCPYGKFSRVEGYTKKARSYSSWIKNKKDVHKDLLNAVEFNTKKLAKIGEYIYLPYPHLKNYVNSLEGIVNEHFIKESDFTDEKILEIINYKPQALFGGTIKDFQKKEVPKFIQHLKEEMPDSWKNLKEKYPDKFKAIKEIGNNYMGRTAYLKTLRVGTTVKDIYGNLFYFDGEHLINENYKPSFSPFETSGGLFKFKAEDNMTVKITDNDQVTGDTKFVD